MGKLLDGTHKHFCKIDDKMLTEIFIHGFAMSCSQEDYKKRYLSVWEDTVVKWHNQKIIKDHIREQWNKTKGSLNVGDTQIKKLLAILSNTKQKFGYIVESRSENIKENLPIIIKERKN